jgi:Sulfotransferase family
MTMASDARTLESHREGARRMLFVGGLHRSGTSIIHRCIARHPAVSGFQATGVPEDEGQHLQSVYPRAYEHGGPGRFGFDAGSHLTESSALVTPENRARLLEEWGRHWDPYAAVLVEKSPPNLVRMRFLKALFPEAAFLMVLRHPAAVACATQKWSRTPWTSLVHHWVVTHETMATDSEHVPSVSVIRYEDFVADPDGVLAAVFHSVGLPPNPAGEEVRTEINQRYLDFWRGTRNPLRVLDRRIAVGRFEQRARRFGYSLRSLEVLPHMEMPG